MIVSVTHNKCYYVGKKRRKCLECKEEINKHHFSRSYRCILCFNQYRTDCDWSYFDHVVKHHSDNPKKKDYQPKYEDYVFKRRQTCACGFQSSSGTELADHLLRCPTSLGTIKVLNKTPSKQDKALLDKNEENKPVINNSKSVLNKKKPDSTKNSTSFTNSKVISNKKNPDSTKNAAAFTNRKVISNKKKPVCTICTDTTAFSKSKVISNKKKPECSKNLAAFTKTKVISNKKKPDSTQNTTVLTNVKPVLSNLCNRLNDDKLSAKLLKEKAEKKQVKTTSKSASSKQKKKLSKLPNSSSSSLENYFVTSTPKSSPSLCISSVDKKRSNCFVDSMSSNSKRFAQMCRDMPLKMSKSLSPIVYIPKIDVSSCTDSSGEVMFYSAREF